MSWVPYPPLASLAYAGGDVGKTPPSRTFARRWSAWLDIRNSGWDKSDIVDGRQINVTGSVGYKLTPEVLIGAFSGYEDFRYDFTAVSGKSKGDGATIRGYAAWHIAPTLRWDAMLGWSRISYDASAGMTRESGGCSNRFIPVLSRFPESDVMPIVKYVKRMLQGAASR